MNQSDMMTNEQKLIEKMEAEQEYIKNIQLSLFENLNILLENQKNKVDNQDVVIQNQGYIIQNQEVIVNNQIKIIQNQHTIMENQATLKAILKVQERVLLLLEQAKGNAVTEAEMSQYVKNIEAFYRSKD